jgi:hypothetical protein
MSNAAVVPAGFPGGREVILQGLSGPAMGLRFEIGEGTAAVFGRGDKAKFAIARDVRLSETHFEIAAAGGRAVLRDLKSEHGTHLNARRVTQADLKHGDVISAGSCTFRVRIQTPETWPDITPAEYALLTLLYGSGERVYAILDSAREDRIPAFLQACDTEYASLFEGHRAYQLRSVAPYIVHVPRGSKILRLLVREGWGKSWGVYLTASASMADLVRHLQRFLVFQTTTGQQYFYRYYDPRVLRAQLAAAPPADRMRFFGPITRFVLEDESPAVALDFWNSPGPAQSRKVVLGPPPAPAAGA